MLRVRARRWNTSLGPDRGAIVQTHALGPLLGELAIARLAEHFVISAPHRPPSLSRPGASPKKFDNAVTRMLGCEIPIVQAPMGWIARAPLASAVCNAGALGIIETSSGETDAIKAEIRKMGELTDKPFGVNIAHAFLRDPSLIDMVIESGVRFVTTSAGDPKKFVPPLKEAGLKVFHVVPSLRAAEKAMDVGVDGLVVEGGEGGGFKNPLEVSTMVLVPLIKSRFDVPIIAAGGICDGMSMAAAFALGAEGVQMGTRMVSAVESPVHHNWKQAIVDAPETGTLYLNDGRGPALRVLRTELAKELAAGGGNAMAALAGGVRKVYFEGDLEGGLALTGEVAGRIDSVKPVAEIIEETVREFGAVVEGLAKAHSL